jgi:hypothetical protein
MRWREHARGVCGLLWPMQGTTSEPTPATEPRRIDRGGARRLMAATGDRRDEEIADGIQPQWTVEPRSAPAVAVYATLVAGMLSLASRGPEHASAGGGLLPFTPSPGVRAGEQEQTMNRISISASVAVSVLAAQAMAGDAVQWKVSEGGNGHWYRVVVVPGDGYPRITWDQAQSRSVAIGGYLATINTLDENAFLYRAISPSMSNQWSCWIGGLRSWNGQWIWVSGEPFSCDTMPGCPFCCGENRLYTGNYGPGPYLWVDDHNNDFQGGKNEYLVEWSADCNSDGIVDYGQILDGSLIDANNNGLPDCCEQGVQCSTCARYDLNLNGSVDGADLGVLLAFWGPVSPAFPRADITGDGKVDGADLGLLLSNWGPCPQ